MLSAYVPSLDSLELLLAIGRTGSLARAGTERGISQAAVSMRVKSIEATVGVRLVERGPMGSRLTGDGALLADWAMGVLRAAEQLDAGIAALRGGRSAHLLIASSLTIAEHLLPGWLNALRVTRPDTAVSLTAVNSAAVSELVLNRQAELGFVEGPRVPRGLASRTVATDTLILICSPTSPLIRSRAGLSAAALASLPLVERESGSGTRASLDAALATALSGHVARPEPVLEVSSTTAVRTAVAAGVGPAVVSSLAVSDDLAAGRLIAVDLPDLDLRRELHAVWLRGQRVLGSARDLLAIASRKNT